MISACGVLCTDCPAYLGASKGFAHQLCTVEAWQRIYGLEEADASDWTMKCFIQAAVVRRANVVVPKGLAPAPNVLTKPVRNWLRHNPCGMGSLTWLISYHPQILKFTLDPTAIIANGWQQPARHF